MKGIKLYYASDFLLLVYTHIMMPMQVHLYNYNPQVKVTQLKLTHNKISNSNPVDLEI
jgi:hypothetical protein